MPYPRPEYERAREDAYEKFKARMASGGMEELELHRQAREEEIRRADEQQRAFDEKHRAAQFGAILM